MKEEVESIVLERVMAGNQAACRYLIDRYKDYVFNIAFRIVRNREEAEEVAQDCFLKAIQNLHTFKYESKFSTWLFRIAYNTSLTRMRKKVLPTRELPDYGEETFHLVSDALPLHDIHKADRTRFLQEGLDLLSGEDSALLTFYYLHELSMDEIATITGLEAALLKVKIHRARKKLHAALTTLLQSETQDL